ncbi:hypothetical protein Mhun_2800 [Methanospirillum hungatei JF-1]|jgi:hypothetical protein|uniref:MarR family transcriptional regulator n=1 Tax=Methanospirillum hungatei JF-1 (strain ATCC 27890 / DSM 864 / NBRC 100397 / JF-1) TaxID=323259 RepID=Q2FS54_METHJ|nr:hypothetical protein [Methanospirillum hungatei]ABD42494.1 hypothetical protein Mhun_2800 [Methanospirillum hungatei JF-1]
MAVESKYVGIVRDEDIDWTLYHLILGNPGCTCETLIEQTGYAQDIVNASLARLKRYCLVDIRDNAWRACSTEEIVLRHQMADIFSDGLELSGGVIRYRPSGEEKK